jgi:hypothetical protein
MLALLIVLMTPTAADGADIKAWPRKAVRYETMGGVGFSEASFTWQAPPQAISTTVKGVRASFLLTTGGLMRIAVHCVDSPARCQSAMTTAVPRDQCGIGRKPTIEYDRTLPDGREYLCRTKHRAEYHRWVFKAGWSAPALCVVRFDSPKTDHLPQLAAACGSIADVATAR